MRELNDENHKRKKEGRKKGGVKVEKRKEKGKNK